MQFRRSPKRTRPASPPAGNRRALRQHPAPPGAPRNSLPFGARIGSPPRTPPPLPDAGPSMRFPFHRRLRRRRPHRRLRTRRRRVRTTGSCLPFFLLSHRPSGRIQGYGTKHDPFVNILQLSYLISVPTASPMAIRIITPWIFGSSFLSETNRLASLASAAEAGKAASGRARKVHREAPHLFALRTLARLQWSMDPAGVKLVKELRV